MSVGQSKTIEDKYQAKVGRLQEADRLYVKSDGYMAFVDYEFDGAELKNILKSLTTVTDNPLVGDSEVLSLFVPPYGYHLFSLPTGCSKASMALPLPSKGHMLILDCEGLVGDATMSFFPSLNGGLTGVSLVRGGTLSQMSNIAVGVSAFIQLICVDDGTWSVVRTINAVEQAE